MDRAPRFATPSAPQPIMFTNCRLFDGTSPGLRGGPHLLVEAGLIADVASGEPGRPAEARLIDWSS